VKTLFTSLIILAVTFSCVYAAEVDYFGLTLTNSDWPNKYFPLDKCYTYNFGASHPDKDKKPDITYDGVVTYRKYSFAPRLGETPICDVEIPKAVFDATYEFCFLTGAVMHPYGAFGSVFDQSPRAGCWVRDNVFHVELNGQMLQVLSARPDLYNDSSVNNQPLACLFGCVKKAKPTKAAPKKAK